MSLVCNAILQSTKLYATEEDVFNLKFEMEKRAKEADANVSLAREDLKTLQVRSFCCNASNPQSLQEEMGTLSAEVGQCSSEVASTRMELQKTNVALAEEKEDIMRAIENVDKEVYLCKLSFLMVDQGTRPYYY